MVHRHVSLDLYSREFAWVFELTEARPDGDFIVSYHPSYDGLFLATGGSGHGYKFFPVLGDKIVDAMEGTLEPGLRQLWEWTDATATSDEEKIFDGDGSRSGERDSILKDELAKTKKSTRGSAL